jgi:hypothetical protein
MMTDTLLGYAGLLYDKTNGATPILNSLAGRDRFVQSRQFILGQDYESEAGTNPSISENASLTAPNPTFVTRTQNTNVTQIFHETIAMSYRKASDGNTLNGLNLAGEFVNPENDRASQIAQKMKKISRQVEDMIINGQYHLAADNTEADQSRGLLEAIATNAVAGDSKALDIWMINDLMDKIYNKNGDITKLTLVVNGTQLNQINGSAVENGLTIVPATRNENGIQITKIIVPLCELDIMLDAKVPAGTAMLLNLGALHLVHQPVPGKGNFFVEELAKTGAKDSEQIYGQVGLDYSNELLHGKITGLATTFTKPVGVKVVTVPEA